MPLWKPKSNRWRKQRNKEMMIKEKFKTNKQKKPTWLPIPHCHQSMIRDRETLLWVNQTILENRPLHNHIWRFPNQTAGPSLYDCLYGKATRLLGNRPHLRRESLQMAFDCLPLKCESTVKEPTLFFF